MNKILLFKKSQNINLHRDRVQSKKNKACCCSRFLSWISKRKLRPLKQQLITLNFSYHFHFVWMTRVCKTSVDTGQHNSPLHHTAFCIFLLTLRLGSNLSDLAYTWWKTHKSPDPFVVKAACITNSRRLQAQHNWFKHSLLPKESFILPASISSAHRLSFHSFCKSHM